MQGHLPTANARLALRCASTSRLRGVPCDRLEGDGPRTERLDLASLRIRHEGDGPRTDRLDPARLPSPCSDPCCVLTSVSMDVVGAEGCVGSRLSGAGG
eukprot:351465-Chlamydomonas_euryale.AAC.3